MSAEDNQGRQLVVITTPGTVLDTGQIQVPGGGAMEVATGKQVVVATGPGGGAIPGSNNGLTTASGQYPPLFAQGSVTLGLTAARTYAIKFVPITARPIIGIAIGIKTAALSDDPIDVGLLDMAGNRLASSGSTNGKLNGATSGIQINFTAPYTPVPGTPLDMVMAVNAPITTGALVIPYYASTTAANEAALLLTNPNITVADLTSPSWRNVGLGVPIQAGPYPAPTDAPTPTPLMVARFA